MNRVYKGAAAAAIGTALLVGGGGTLAFWTDSAPISGTTISSGQLSLGDAACGAGWTFGDGTVFTDQLVVPGDTLTKTCTVDLVASGANLSANLSAGAPSWETENPLTAELAVSASFTVNGVAKSVVTSADDTGTSEISAVMTVTFTGATATNASQGLTAALSGVDIVATQTTS